MLNMPMVSLRDQASVKPWTSTRLEAVTGLTELNFFSIRETFLFVVSDRRSWSLQNRACSAAIRKAALRQEPGRALRTAARRSIKCKTGNCPRWSAPPQHSCRTPLAPNPYAHDCSAESAQAGSEEHTPEQHPLMP